MVTLRTEFLITVSIFQSAVLAGRAGPVSAMKPALLGAVEPQTQVGILKPQDYIKLFHTLFNRPKLSILPSARWFASINLKCYGAFGVDLQFTNVSTIKCIEI